MKWEHDTPPRLSTPTLPLVRQAPPTAQGNLGPGQKNSDPHPALRAGSCEMLRRRGHPQSRPGLFFSPRCPSLAWH